MLFGIIDIHFGNDLSELMTLGIASLIFRGFRFILLFILSLEHNIYQLLCNNNDNKLIKNVLP